MTRGSSRIISAATKMVNRAEKILVSEKFCSRTWAMNWDEIAGTWRQFKGKAKERWGKLTNNDLMTIDGKREQSAGVLQREYGSAKAQSNKQFGPGAPTLIPVTNPTHPGDPPGNRR
jgi:uncharacterized protein YjbJ (UPF0337 family)